MRYSQTLIIIVIMSCFSGCPNPPDPREEPDTRIYLELIDYWTTSVTLKISVADSTQTWGFALSRNDSIVQDGEVNEAGIVIIGEDLTPGFNYTYVAYYVNEGSILDSSSALLVHTRETQEFLGLEGKRITCMKMFQDELFVGTQYNGLWRLDVITDSSEWEYLGLASSEVGFDNYYLSDIIQSSTETSEMIVTGSTHSELTRGTFRTSDRGINWSMSGEESEPFPDIQKFQTSGDRVIAWGYMGQWVSYDFGEIWRRDTIEYANVYGFTRIDVFEKCESADNYLWMAGDTPLMSPQLIRSIDGGYSWVGIPLDDDFYIVSIAIHPTNPNIIYLVSNGMIYKTEDGGDAWIASILNATSDPISDPELGWIGAIEIDDNNPQHIFAAGGIFLYESYDSGLTWHQIETLISEEEFVLMIHLDRSSDTLLLGATSGVYAYRVHTEGES